MNVAQLFVAMVALVLLLSPLFVMAFLAGRRSSSKGISRQFDRMPAEIVLESGSWQAEFDGDQPNTVDVVMLEIEQVGNRIVGAGHSSDGTRHSLEGLLHQRHLCYICLDENRQGVWLGTVTGELLPGEQQIVGMRTRWSPQSQALIVRKAVLTRTV